MENKKYIIHQYIISITISTKKFTVHLQVCSILRYDCEIWAMRAENIKLSAFDSYPGYILWAWRVDHVIASIPLVEVHLTFNLSPSLV